MTKKVAVIGTFDTKGEEYKFLKERIEANGVKTIMIDVGIFGTASTIAHITATEVAEAAHSNLRELAKEQDRNQAMKVMSKGAAIIVKTLYEQQKIDGIIAMGGGNGTTIGTTAMKVLPIGVPKLMISTLASGDTRKYVGEMDIMMMPSIVDIAGINRFSSKILSNAAGCIAGMVLQENHPLEKVQKPLIAATMFGVTTPCVTRAKEILEDAGYEVLVFHTVGSGGRSMEELIRSNYFSGVLDLTTTELADELVGGTLSAGPNRLEAAAEMGVPQVVSAGALDMINFGPIHSVPDKFKNRQLYEYNPLTTLMRTTVEENRELGKWMAEKLNKSKGPTTFMMPAQGVSYLDTKGKPLFDPKADAAFLNEFKAKMNKNIKLVEMDTDINDEEFAVMSAHLLLESINRSKNNS